MSGSKKDLQNRISAIGSIMKVTNAMKVVAASKIRKYKLTTNNASKYYQESLSFLNLFYKDVINEYNIQDYNDTSNKNLLIVIGSNKGLCGSFNSVMARMVSKSINPNSFSLFVIGKKMEDALYRSFKIFKTDHSILNDVSFSKVEDIYNYIMLECRNKTFQDVYIAFNTFEKNTNKAVIHRLYPIKYKNKNQEQSDNFIFEPNKDRLFKKVIDNYISSKIYYTIYQSILSENTSRMIAMYQATENASNLESELTIRYNKIRQSSITNQILEIVSASEAMQG